MSRNSSPIIDASVSRVKYDPELDDPQLDNHQPTSQRRHSQKAYSQDAVHGLINDYLKSGDALLVQEGERMRAAGEGRKVTEHRSGERRGRKRPASNDGEDGSDRTRRLRRDSYVELLDNESSQGGQPRHVNNPNNLPAVRTEAPSFVINGSGHTINVNIGVESQTISYSSTPANLQGNRHRNILGYPPLPELLDGDDDAEFRRHLDNLERRHLEELAAYYGDD